MANPISIRLDDDVRTELERQAEARGIGLATLLRDLATVAAREARRKRIHSDSAQVAASADARAFYAEWGTPHTDVR